MTEFMKTLECSLCREKLDWVSNGKVATPRQGKFLVPLMGPACEGCADKVLDESGSDIGILGFGEVKREWISDAILSYQSDWPYTPTAAWTMSSIFDWDQGVVESAAFRLHGEGDEVFPYSLIDLAIKKKGKNQYLEVARASMLSVEGDVDSAIEIMEDLRPDCHENYYLIYGNLFAGNYDWVNAEMYWRRQLELSDSHAQIYHNLGNHYMSELQDPVGAEEIYRKAIDSHPEDYNLQAFLGESLRLQGKNSEAIEFYNNARTLCPNDDIDMLNHLDHLISAVQ